MYVYMYVRANAMLRVVLIQLILVVNTCIQCDNIVSVDPSSGEDDPRCLVPLSGVRCATLGYALQYSNHSTLYLLSGGEHSLAAGVNTIANLRNVTIASNDTSSTVRCVVNGGLSFENVSFLSIENVIFLGCGALRNSTSRNLSDADSPYILVKFSVALYFYLCDSVSLFNVTVANSAAIGVVMYDTTGQNLISNSVFSNNVVMDSGTPGGGGFNIEFTYSVPGDTCSPLTLYHNTGSVYDFVNCTFSQNKANDGFVNGPIFIIPYECNHDIFGKGGGLALFFKGSASGNTIRLSNCTFQNNSADWGGGIYVEFQDAASGNLVEIQSFFLGNSASIDGGGLHLAYYNPGYNLNIAANNITLSSSSFVNNRAFTGGAFTVLPSLLDIGGSIPKILLHNCSFDSNVAEIGSAMYGSYVTLNAENLAPVIDIQTCTFANNTLTTDNTMSEHYIGVGAVYLNGIPARFYDVIVFQQNSGSALAAVSTYVDFTSCNISFLNNTGDNGGAISLLGAASILISNYTYAQFVGNTASSYGGAIYNTYVERESFSLYPNCFIQYNDHFLPPDQWIAHFVFRNNSASISGDSIYSTSILPCSLFTATPSQSQTVFCWNHTYWDYDDSCADEIGTGFGKLSVISTVQTSPGLPYKLPINMTDELGNDILRYTAFTATIGSQDPQQVAMVDPGFYFVSDGLLQLNGNGNNQTVILNLDGSLMGHWHSKLPVQLLPCPPGMSQKSNGSSAICLCDPNKTFNSVLLCLGYNSGNASTLIKAGYWIGFVPEASSAGLVVAACPQGFCTSGMVSTSSNASTAVVQLSDGYVTLPMQAGELGSAVCAANRMGVLCGECSGSYAPSINDDAYSCVPCNSSQVIGNIFKHIGIVYVPLVLFFLVIIFFNVPLTTGPANAFILFSQGIVTTFDTTLNGQLSISSSMKTFLEICFFVYRIFNLDFFAYLLDPFCVGTQHNTLDVIELNYVVAVVPCVMILMVIACYQMANLTCISKLCQCNKTHAKQLACTKAIKVSPILAFAALLLLAYNKVSVTASKILSQVRFIDSSGTTVSITRLYYAAQYDVGYWRYALPSSIITILIIVLPFILLEFPVRLFEKFISRVPVMMKYYPAAKVNIFLDAFQGCFHDNRRYFASAYFFFRLIVNVLLEVLPTLSLQITCQQLLCITMVVLIAFLQPYKVPAYNCIDILFFANLAFIGALNQYMLQTSNNVDQMVTTNAVSVVLSILTSLPLVYIVGYIIWHFLVEPRKGQIASTLSLLKQKFMYLHMRKIVENNTATGGIHLYSLETEVDHQKNAMSYDLVTTAVDDDDVIDARVSEQIQCALNSDADCPYYQFKS